MRSFTGYYRRGSNQLRYDGCGIWHEWVSIDNAQRILVGKTEVKRPLGRPSRRQKDNTKKVVQKLIEKRRIYSSHVGYGQVVGPSGNDISICTKCGKFLY
jgi:hypothetical protein